MSDNEVVKEMIAFENWVKQFAHRLNFEKQVAALKFQNAGMRAVLAHCNPKAMSKKEETIARQFVENILLNQWKMRRLRKVQRQRAQAIPCAICSAPADKKEFEYQCRKNQLHTASLKTRRFIDMSRYKPRRGEKEVLDV